jgi:hypothetical protein
VATREATKAAGLVDLAMAMTVAGPVAKAAMAAADMVEEAMVEEAMVEEAMAAKAADRKTKPVE